MVVLGELVTSIISINKHLTEHPNYRNLTKLRRSFFKTPSHPTIGRIN